MSIIHVPKLSLVVLIGATGSGKSSFARRHFKPTEIVSSDTYRGLVSDDENGLEASSDAFELLYHTVHIRLRRGLLTVIDATHVREEDRAKVIAMAREHDVFAIAIVLALPEQVCAERNALRPDRQFGRHVIAGHCRNVQRSIPHLERERFRFVHVLRSQEAIDAVAIERQPSWSDKTDDRGPFDIIGDVHGCFDELIELLTKLGYDTTAPERITAPPGRKAIFVGDLVDRGPHSVRVLETVMSMVHRGVALCVAGNHDVKLLKALAGRKVKLSHGLEETMKQFEPLSPERRDELRQFLDARISHYQLDGGSLVVAHAGMKEQYIGRTSGRVREFALYGDTTGEVDDEGLPVRLDWAAEYRGRASIVYGHIVVERSQWLNNTICVDTGCCFGGKLTALRWPERDLVEVPAKAIYVKNPRKKATLAANAQQAHDRTLDLADVLGKRVVDTRLSGNVMIREENATAALEVISRFAVDPRWLIYLPPTMSPSATTEREGYLEHPDEAFRYFAESGVGEVVCEEKHMGSRAVVIVCRDEAAAAERFGIEGDGSGVIITRTGRRFFDDRATEAAMLDRVREAATAGGLWDELSTTWLALDCELMPWSAKARDLLSNQYAAVGSAAKATLALAADVFRAAAGRLPELQPVLSHTLARQQAAERYVQSYQRYCWDVVTLDDYRLAPFHLLASEGAAHADKPHAWHLSLLAKLVHEPTIIATRHRFVDLADIGARESATAWWTEHTGAGGEGMVVKPASFATFDSRGRLIQPAVKCRGREYLRIIYGAEYDLPANLVRLRKRGLAGKRSLAAREFALGIEGLERFVRREPLRRVHECVFGVLAMESEPVDPRL